MDRGTFSLSLMCTLALADMVTYDGPGESRSGSINGSHGSCSSPLDRPGDFLRGRVWVLGVRLVLLYAMMDRGTSLRSSEGTWARLTLPGNGPGDFSPRSGEDLQSGLLTTIMDRGTSLRSLERTRPLALSVEATAPHYKE